MVWFLYVNHELYSPNIYDIQLIGTGDAYAFRDGQAYKVKWVRNATDVVSLTNPDGTPFAFKPGTTCFEVVGFKIHSHANRSELAVHPFYALKICCRGDQQVALLFIINKSLVFHLPPLLGLC